MNSKLFKALIVPLCVLALALLWINVSNFRLLASDTHSPQLTDNEISLIEEALALQKRYGDQLAMGWSRLDTPIILSNDAYSFLINFPGEPTNVWIELPNKPVQGSDWQRVDNFRVNGRLVYRRPLALGQTAPTDVVKIDNLWAASIKTKTSIRQAMAQQTLAQWPQWVHLFIPVGWLSQQSLQDSDHYIGLVVHQLFHAYQAQRSTDRVIIAAPNPRLHDRLRTTLSRFGRNPQYELNTLAQGMLQPTQVLRQEYFHQFSDLRDQRYLDMIQTADLIEYEQQREWLEGEAKFVEMNILMLAQQDGRRVANLLNDSEFNHYQQANIFWKQQIEQIRSVGEGEERYAYSGWAKLQLKGDFPLYREQPF